MRESSQTVNGGTLVARVEFVGCIRAKWLFALVYYSLDDKAVENSKRDLQVFVAVGLTGISRQSIPALSNVFRQTPQSGMEAIMSEVCHYDIGRPWAGTCMRFWHYVKDKKTLP